MKPLRFAVFSLTATSLLALGTACTSDTNPFDVKATITKTEPAKIQLHLNVAATRADMSTDAEKKITRVSIYVFNEEGLLETFQSNKTVSDGTTESMEITSGMKTVYAVAGKDLTNTSASIAIGMTISDFEDIVFDSKMTDLNSSTGFMMVGNGQQMVYASAVNNISIELVRLIAKAQLRLGDINTEAFGFTHGNATYYVAQTCNRMRLQPKGSDILAPYSKHTLGTYDGYTRLTSTTPNNGVTGEFTAAGCAYLSENIVEDPKAGNTTFLILEIPLTPQYNYDYTTYNNQLTSSPLSNPANVYTFYAVGIVDAVNGHEDFVMDGPNKRVVTFTNSKAAEDYAKALNAGTTSGMTVSEFDSPMRAAATRASNSDYTEFKVVMFSNKNAYYRINITGEDGTLRVDRNTFYKVTVNSIKSLGCHDMELLYPTDPESDYTTPTSAMLGVKFRVAEWDEVDQDVDLD